MSIKLLSLFFLVYLSSTYCSDCTDKTSFEKDEDKESACEELLVVIFVIIIQKMIAVKSFIARKQAQIIVITYLTLQMVEVAYQNQTTADVNINPALI